MNIERINLNNIPDPQTRQVVSQLADCVFELNRELKRTLNQLTSQNVKEIDFNVTRVKNLDKIINKEG